MAVYLKGAHGSQTQERLTAKLEDAFIISLGEKKLSGGPGQHFLCFGEDEQVKKVRRMLGEQGGLEGLQIV